MLNLRFCVCILQPRRSNFVLGDDLRRHASWAAWCAFLSIQHNTSLCGWIPLKVEMHTRMDILRGIGFMVALQMAKAWVSLMNAVSFTEHCLFWQARRLVRHGTMWIGVPCSSWIFMCGALPWTNIERERTDQMLIQLRSRGSTHRGYFRPQGGALIYP